MILPNAYSCCSSRFPPPPHAPPVSPNESSTSSSLGGNVMVQMHETRHVVGSRKDNFKTCYTKWNYICVHDVRTSFWEEGWPVIMSTSLRLPLVDNFIILPHIKLLESGEVLMIVFGASNCVQPNIVLFVRYRVQIIGRYDICVQSRPTIYQLISPLASNTGILRYLLPRDYGFNAAHGPLALPEGW